MHALRRLYEVVADFDPFGSLHWTLQLIVAFALLVIALAAVPAIALRLTGATQVSDAATAMAFGAFLFVASHQLARAHFPSARPPRLRYVSFVYRLLSLAVPAYITFLILR